MANFQKQGYSTVEVAQILGCTPCTVRLKINTGKLKADMAYTGEKAKNRNIRITREQLVDYLKTYSSRYSKELLRSFGIGDETKESVKQDIGTPKPTGAWAELLEDYVRGIPNTTPTPPDAIVADPKPVCAPNPTQAAVYENLAKATTKAQTASVLVDGRICVGNVKEETAKVIFDAIMNDDVCDFREITIRRVK